MVYSADQSGFFTTTLESALGWARKYSLFSYPFVTACCGMEFMSVNCSHYDTDRFGAALPRFTPRQSDLLWVVGTVNHKLAPVLLRVYEQMAEPKWVIAFGACASSGGFYDNYTTVAGIDKIIPVDMYIPGCPPRPYLTLSCTFRPIFNAPGNRSCTHKVVSNTTPISLHFLESRSIRERRRRSRRRSRYVPCF